MISVETALGMGWIKNGGVGEFKYDVSDRL
jgi:hypothetical protein